MKKTVFPENLWNFSKHDYFALLNFVIKLKIRLVSGRVRCHALCNGDMHIYESLLRLIMFDCKLVATDKINLEIGDHKPENWSFIATLFLSSINLTRK